MNGRKRSDRSLAVAPDDAGQALVEFALVLPIILLLLFGMLQFGLVLNARQTVAYAAQAAANGYAQTLRTDLADRDAEASATQLRPALRAPIATIEYLVASEREESICVRAERRRSFGFGRRSRTVCTRYETVKTSYSERPARADAPGRPGEFVIARVTYRYPSPVNAGIGGFRFPSAFPMTAEAAARIEADRPAQQAVAAAPPRCYTVSAIDHIAWRQVFSQEPYRVSVLVDGSPASTVRLVPGTPHTVSLVLRISDLFVRLVVPGSEEQVAVRDTVVIAPTGFSRLFSGGPVYFPGAYGFNYYATVNIQPKATC